MAQLPDSVWDKARACFLFHHMEAGRRDTLLATLDAPSRFSKGERIYSGAHFRRALGILLKGEAQVSRTGADGRRTVMNRLGPGQVFGVAALFGDDPSYVTDVEAAAECLVLFLPQETITRWVREEPPVAENYIRFLSGRIRFLNGRIASLTNGQADDRLRRFLIEHCGEDGEVALPRSMTELAGVLHIGRSSLYRSLEALEDEGFIRREGRHIFIEDIRRETDWI